MGSYRNASGQEQTIKNMFSALDADNYTIDKVLVYCNYNDQCVCSYRIVLDKYFDYFKEKLVEVDVPEKYYYSPSWFSEVYYGTPDLDWLILYFANMTTLFQFDRPKIKVLPLASIVELNRLWTQLSDETKANYKTPTVFKE